MTEPLDADAITHLEAILAGAGQSSDDRAYVLASIWTQENIPPITSDTEARTYREAADDLSRTLPPRTDPKYGAAFLAFSRTMDGILATAYGARVIEWEERDA